MWIPALFLFGTVVWVLLHYWQYTLAVMVVVFCWKVLFARRPVPARKPLPAPRHEPPSPGYLRKWNSGRRADAVREHALWQETFDRSIPPGRGSTMGVARPRRVPAGEGVPPQGSEPVRGAAVRKEGSDRRGMGASGAEEWKKFGVETK